MQNTALLQPVCFQHSASLIYSLPWIDFIPHQNMALETSVYRVWSRGPSALISPLRNTREGLSSSINGLELWPWGTGMGTCVLLGDWGGTLPRPPLSAETSPRGKRGSENVCFWNVVWLLGFFVVCFVLNHRKLLGLQRVPSISTPRSVYNKHPTESHREREISDDRR